MVGRPLSLQGVLCLAAALKLPSRRRRSPPTPQPGALPGTKCVQAWPARIPHTYALEDIYILFPLLQLHCNEYQPRSCLHFCLCSTPLFMKTYQRSLFILNTATSPLFLCSLFFFHSLFILHLFIIFSFFLLHPFIIYPQPSFSMTCLAYFAYGILQFLRYQNTSSASWRIWLFILTAIFNISFMSPSESPGFSNICLSSILWVIPRSLLFVLLSFRHPALWLCMVATYGSSSTLSMSF